MRGLTIVLAISTAVAVSAFPASVRIHRLHLPPPVPKPLPPPPPPPPAVVPTGPVVGVPYTCTGAVSGVVVQGTGSSQTALVNLNQGCTGTISLNITITSGGGDGVKVNTGAHDLTIGPSTITCSPGVSGRDHQDGVQVQGGTNVTFVGLRVQCSSVNNGAAAFYIDGKDFPGISNVICDGCNLEHSHAGAVFTAPAPGSGVRNSVIHQGTATSSYYAITGSGAVNDNNTLAPACDGVTVPC